MSETIKTFTSEQFGDVRVTTINGEPWFVAADVCRVLEISNPSMALNRLDDDEKMTLNSTEGHSGSRGGAQFMNVVNEPGLYSLTLGSRKPQAKEFKRWITHEVIPSIRKHGAYMTPETIEKVLFDPDFIIRLATDLKTERELRMKLERKVEEDAPKVLLAEQVSASHDSIMVKQLAHILTQNGFEVGQNELFARLRFDGYLCMARGKRWNTPTQMAIEKGLFDVQENPYHTRHGIRLSYTTYVTPRGQKYFLDRYVNKLSDTNKEN